MWDFCVLDDVDFPYCNRVHPLMQKRVQKILDYLRNDKNIESIVLFGSTLEFRCSSNSDIDLYIEKYDPNKPLKWEPELDCEVDIITNLNHDSSLYREIEQNGLLLFKR